MLFSYNNSNSVIAESTLGKVGGSAFKVDISFDRSNHAPRIKVTRSNSIGFGTCVPIDTRLGPDPTFDVLASHPEIKVEKETKEYLNLIIGFVVVHHRELVVFTDYRTDSSVKYSMLKSLKNEWEEYYKEFGGCNKNEIKRYADEYVYNLHNI